MKLFLIPVRGYLTKKGAGAAPHVHNKSLLDHLERVCGLVEDWGLDLEAQKVALCHSIYSTSHYEKKLIEESERENIQMLIGESAEKLVSYFSILDRSSLSADQESAEFSFLHRITKEKVSISEAEFRILLHVLLANLLDHIDPLNAEQVMAQTNSFAKFKPFIQEKTWGFLVQSGMRTDLSENKSVVRFIGHAGVWLKTNDVSLAVDPWLYSSTLSSPLLQGTAPDQRTIDYLIPRPVFSSADIAPDIVMYSHLHSHHSPFRELRDFAAIKPIHVICPPIPEALFLQLKERFTPEELSNITFHFCKVDSIISIKGLTIEALTHTQRNHLAYIVSNGYSSFMHLADGTPNLDSSLLSLDPIWKKFAGKKPDYLFISASNHMQRMLEGGVRDIHEHRTFSPVQAVKFAITVQPKHIGLTGMYNFSIWDSLLEFTHASQDIENEFTWALSYLAPSIELHLLRPGRQFDF